MSKNALRFDYLFFYCISKAPMLIKTWDVIAKKCEENV